MRKKICLSVCLVILIISMFPAFVSARSFESVPVVFAGWSISPNTPIAGFLINIRNVGGVNNNWNPHPVNYTFSQTFNQAILFGSTLSSQLSASIGATTGAVSGGLGAQVNKSFNIQSNFTYSYTESFSMIVPAYTNLVLQSYIRGSRVTGFAKTFFVWIETNRGQYELQIPSYQIFMPVIT